MNFVSMSGTLLQDPIVNQTQDGKMNVFGKFGVYQGKNQDGSYKPSIIFDFVSFGLDAEQLKDAHKGDVVAVQGRLEEATNTSNDGRTFINKKIVANAAKLLVKPVTQQNQQQVYQQPAPQQGYAQPYGQPAPQQGYAQPQVNQVSPW